MLPSRLPHKPKTDLPIILGGRTVHSLPGSGSEENIIAKDLADALGLKYQESPQEQMEFRRGNNKIFKAIGCVTVLCKFAKDPDVQIERLLHVLKSLVRPLIMGMKFLDVTETLTKNNYRLQSSLARIYRVRI